MPPAHLKPFRHTQNGSFPHGIPTSFLVKHLRLPLFPTQPVPSGQTAPGLLHSWPTLTVRTHTLLIHLNPCRHTQNGSFPHGIPTGFLIKHFLFPSFPTQLRPSSHTLPGKLHERPLAIACTHTPRRHLRPLRQTQNGSFPHGMPTGFFIKHFLFPTFPTQLKPSWQTLPGLLQLPPRLIALTHVPLRHLRPLSQTQKGSLPQAIPSAFFIKHLLLPSFPTHIRPR